MVRRKTNVAFRNQVNSQLMKAVKTALGEIKAGDGVVGAVTRVHGSRGAARGREPLGSGRHRHRRIHAADVREGRPERHGLRCRIPADQGRIPQGRRLLPPGLLGGIRAVQVAEEWGGFKVAAVFPIKSSEYIKTLALCYHI